eukprot:1140007-Pelagomonas_calceolata.AAC.2
MHASAHHRSSIPYLNACFSSSLPHHDDVLEPQRLLLKLTQALDLQLILRVAQPKTTSSSIQDLPMIFYCTLALDAHQLILEPRACSEPQTGKSPPGACKCCGIRFHKQEKLSTSSSLWKNFHSPPCAHN